MAKGLCKYDYVKEDEMRLSCIILVGQLHHKCPRGRGGMQKNQSQRRCSKGSRDWSEAIAGLEDGGGHSHRMQAASAKRNRHISDF